MQNLIDTLSFNMIIISLEHTDETTQPLSRILKLNHSAAEILGYGEQELINQPIERLFASKNELTLWYKAIAMLNNSSADNCFEADLVTKDQHRIHLLLAVYSLPDPVQQPNITNVILLLQTINPDSDCSMMYSVVEQSASAVMITDHTGRIDYVNPKFTELTGYTFEELLGRNPKLLQSGNMPVEHYQKMWDTLANTGEWHGELQNQKKNGEVYWAYESISAIKNSAGELTHFVAVEEDITRRKEIESALAESEERFRQMAEMTCEWLWEQDPKGFYLYSSIAVQQILGYSQEQIIGKHYTEFLTIQDKEIQTLYTASQQAFYALINHYQHKDGHQVLTESTGLPIFNDQGDLLKWRGVDRDITARKAAEKQMRAAEVKLAVAQHEIHIAQKIQASLLPALPIKHANFVVTGLCLPADQIGGDYFDYFFSGEDCLDLVIADVSGHSIGPALFMVEARSVIRTPWRA